MTEDKKFIRRAVELALQAEKEGNLPVGAIIVLNSEIIAEGKNSIWAPNIELTRHAEMEALRSLPQDLLEHSDRMILYSTLEPCPMCSGSILLYRIGKVVFGSTDQFGGSGSVLAHLPPYFQERFSETQWVGPALAEECDPLHERLLAMERPR